ncbi:MAG: response regulator [Candidatus Magnetomorum sp.]|nr:response regulator [Candidatus Magnetomorum sp.]
MTEKIFFKSIKARLTFWFFFIAILPLIILGYNVYLQRIKSIKQEAFIKLTAIRDLKVDQLNTWIDERTGDIRCIAENSSIRALEPVFQNKNRTENSKLLENANKELNSFVVNFISYYELFIIHSTSGHVEVSTDQSSVGTDKSSSAYFQEPLRTGNLFIQGIYYSKTVHKPSMTFSIPLRSLSSPKIFGIVVARIDLSASLYHLFLDRTGMGKTGETLIVNKDVIALNALRWFDNAPLKLKIDARPAILASQGKKGIIETTDYRGEKVLAAYTYIPRTRWGFVSKQDLNDIYSPIYIMIQGIVILLIISGLIAFFLSSVLANAIANPILKMANVSKKIQEGQYDARIINIGKDELGILAADINDMAASIQSNIHVQNTASAMMKQLLATSNLETFGNVVLEQLLIETDSQYGGFYIRSGDEKQFNYLCSIGIGEQAFQSFDALSLEGEFGKVFATKKISHLKDIPTDTVISFKTFIGTIIPKEIITIPVLVEASVMGIISLGNVRPYTRESIQLVSLIWSGMNTIFYNMMVNAKTAELAAELKHKNTTLEANSTAMKSLNTELKTQARKLEAQRIQVEDANRLKSEFLSNMSHELRTPLNSVMALSRVLIMQAKDKLSEDEGHYLHIIERNGKRLLSLINDILDLSKIESGRMDLEISYFSVEKTLDTIVESLVPIAEEKGIKIINHQSHPLPFIQSDETRVHQIIQNILGNAVKFTNEGSVTLSSTNDSKSIIITVKDTGIGIAEKELPYVFDEFRQVDGSMSRKFEGTGLGLAIAQKAAQMLGGKIIAESEVNKGSMFIIVLPIETGTQSVESQRNSLIPDTGGKLQRKTILSIDDDPGTLNLLSSFLSNEGYHTMTTTSGEEAILLAQTNRLFAITLDVIMPDMDGWEVLQTLKNEPTTRDIPVIMISISDDRETGFALGAMGYVTKPIQKDVLLHEIRKSTNNKIHTIMLVEDNPLELNQMERIILNEGFQPIPANNGLMCLELMKETTPDVLVLDLMMPGMDGFQVIEHMRSHPEAREIPVIVVTAKDLTSDDKKKLSRNVFSILSKNETVLTELLLKIKSILSNLSTLEPGAEPKESFSESEKKLLLVEAPIIQKKSSMESFPTVLKKSKILIVEDNPDNMTTIKAILQNQYEIIEATDGEQGLEKAFSEKPDLMILDISLPRLDGYSVAKKIRADHALNQLPIIGMTAHAMKGDQEKILTAGCNEYISKPIDPETVMALIHKWL